MEVDLLVIPFFDYRTGQLRGFRDRDTHFLEFLASGRERTGKVLIVDRPTSLAEVALRRSGWHVSGGDVLARGWGWRLTGFAPELAVLDVLDPAILGPALLRRAWWIKAYSSPRLAKIVRAAMARLGITSPVFILHHPFGFELARQVPGRGLVFDAMDNYLKLPHFAAARAELERIYDRIRETADAVIAVSPEVRTNLFQDHPAVTVVRNGVDPALFAAGEHVDPPFALDVSGGPLIGFIGTLAERVDVKLLEEVARERPKYQFVLIGPMVNAKLFRSLQRLPNVRVFPPLHYRFVPGLMRRFDVCMLPMSVGQFENDGDSIKLYEYIATGRPVVATPTAGLDQFRPFIQISSCASGFAKALDKAVARGRDVAYPAELLAGRTWPDYARALLTAAETCAASAARPTL